MIAAKTPDFGFAINAVRGESPEFWSAGGAPQNIVNGHPYIFNSLPNALKAYGNFPKKMAVLAYSIPISADAGQQFLNLFVNSGSSACFSDFSVSPVTASLDSDVLQMKQRGCDGVFTTMDVTGNAKLYEAMQRQGFKPAFNGTTFDGYTPAQISVAGASAAQGLEVNLPFIDFASNNPIINEYTSELSTYEPGKQPSGFGIEAWASAQMLIYALVKAGRNPTRAAVTAAMTAINSWDPGGATSALVPRTRVGGPCGMEVVVNSGAFQRKWPSSGFYCNGVETRVG
jgi:ABC-type branched-subunit amino acid transport system substrate-binding protein